MVHFLQVQRKENLQRVKAILAKSMPMGLREGKFQALLSREFGFSKAAINDYLSILLDTSEIEFENLMWKLVPVVIPKIPREKTEKNKPKKRKENLET